MSYLYQNEINKIIDNIKCPICGQAVESVSFELGEHIDGAEEAGGISTDTYRLEVYFSCSSCPDFFGVFHTIEVTQ